MRPAVLLALAAVLALAGCNVSGDVSAESGVPTCPAAQASAAPGQSDSVRVAVVGDSITDVQSEDFSAGRIDRESWACEILGDGRTFAGGWAVWGATTEQMALGVEPLAADVLIILAGTNDAALRVPFEETAANLESIAETIGAPRVVVSAIPPLDLLPGASEEFNAQLEELAHDEGWEFVDPMEAIRSNGAFREGMSDDGIHPTARASRLIGREIEAAVWQGDAAS